MRVIPSLLLILCLSACQRGQQNNADAVRQGVIDYLTKAGINVAAMDVTMAKVDYNPNGDQADAAVAMTIKGKSDSIPMNFKYHLEHQKDKWVVTGKTAETGHGGEVDPNAATGGANPHGGAMPPAGGGTGKMPSPNDLPPATKK